MPSDESLPLPVSSWALKWRTQMLQLSPTQLAGIFIGVYIAYCLWLSFYRIYLSPLRRIPGSKLTIATSWYETYLEVFKGSQGGQLVFKLEEWHRKYGPVIRINPSEVHIADPEFYDVLYSSKSKLSKTEEFRPRFGLPNAFTVEVHHRDHRPRRQALNPFFAKQKIYHFAWYIQEQADKLCARLEGLYKDTGAPVSMNEAWAAFVADAITFFCFDQSYNFLQYPNFEAPFTVSMRKLASSIHISSQFPWFLKLARILPEALTELINPDMAVVFKFHEEIKIQVRDVMNSFAKGYSKADHPTVFFGILNSNIPPQVKTFDHLYQDAASIVGAGVETTKTTLVMAAWQILSRAEIHERLYAELCQVQPDLCQPAPTLAELEKLPYLTAIIKESLRLSYGISQRLVRVNHEATTVCQGFEIPPGTPISMSSFLMHRNDDIFPQPLEFRPERWLEENKVASGKLLSRYLVPFGAGPRMCLGLHFANAELYIGLATVFRRLNLRPWETTEDDIRMAADSFVPIPKKGAKGLRVVVE